MSNTSYFITKVDNFASLKKCVHTGKWACRDRSCAPQPRDFLADAFQRGQVVVIFSVVNNHGWHGIAELRSSPNSDISKTDQNIGKNIGVTNAEHINSTERRGLTWYYFDVKWIMNFLEFGEQCLPSKFTEDLMCMEGDKEIQVNKCRNWQELNQSCGEKLCIQMNQYYDDLKLKQKEKEEKMKENIPKPFYEGKEAKSVTETWRSIVDKVEKELGKVILACPFGSQRYNLQTADSDTDMFVVYQAKTCEVLGFQPPKQTIKNYETESCDYTIHEVYRWCELLLSGDARCVETLFLHDNTVVKASDEWRQLKEWRKLFLNRQCLEKYLRDAKGSKGTKYLRKWCEENPQATHLSPKMCKMLYVIVRLLQNARDIVMKRHLEVYREDNSAERTKLLNIRAGNVAVQEAWDIINSYEACINDHIGEVPNTEDEVNTVVQRWLIQLRYDNFLSTHNRGLLS